MAEFYGEKPKRFTKEWWQWFWLYHKWYCIGIALAVMVVGAFITDYITRERYDLEIVYLGTQRIPLENLEAVGDGLTDVISDADGNKKNEISVIQLNIADKENTQDMTFAYRQKRDLEISTNKYAYMYVYDRAEAESILAQKGIDSLYKATEEWFEGDIASFDTVCGIDGKPYAISLKNSGIFADESIDSSNLYVMIKNDEYSKSKNDIAEENAVAAANKLLK